MEDDSTTCPNCQKAIPTANFTVHSAHCHSRLIVCKLCKESIPRKEVQSHMDSFHKKVSCEKCHESVEKGALEVHKQQLCSKRLLLCPYCDMDVIQEELKDHEAYCGTRTDKCDKCGQYVMMKDQLFHKTSGECTKASSKVQASKLPASSFVAADSFLPVDLDHSNIKVNKISIIKREALLPSPNKRTNDMPQVNIDADGAKRKETKKPAIQSGRSEELDALLALQLSEDRDDRPSYVDANTQNSSSIVMPPFQFFNSLTERNILNPDPFAHPRSIWEDTEDEMANNFISPFQDRIGQSQDSLLPCEFCNGLFTGDELILHQSGCRPDLVHGGDLANGSVGLPTYDDDDDDEWVVLATARSAAESATQLPCEFCNELFSTEYLLEHQNYCEANPRSREASPMKQSEQKNLLQRPVPDKIVFKSEQQKVQPVSDPVPEKLLETSASPRKSFLNENCPKAASTHVSNYKSRIISARPTSEKPISLRTVPIKVASNHPSLRSKFEDGTTFRSPGGLITARLCQSGNEEESANQKLFAKQVKREMNACRDNMKTATGTYPKFQLPSRNVPQKTETVNCENLNRRDFPSTYPKFQLPSRNVPQKTETVNCENLNRRDLPRHLDVGNSGVRDAYQNLMRSSNVRTRTRETKISSSSYSGAVPKNKDL